MSPEGEIIVGNGKKIELSYHFELGLSIIKKLERFRGEKGLNKAYSKVLSAGFSLPTEYLESIGWIRLHEGYWVRGFNKKDKNFRKTGNYYKENDVQLEIIKRWCEVNKVDFEKDCFYYI